VAPAQSQPRRLAHLDGLRGLAALAVVLHHAWLTIWPFEYGRAPRGLARVTDVLAYGHFPVGVFIVVSGFCLMRPVCAAGELGGGALAFLRRRARRILPPYYAAVGLSLLLVWTVVGADTGTHWDISVPVSAAGYLGNLLLLQDVVGAGQVNHAFWSIAVECQIYLLFPALVVLWRRRGAATALAAAAAISAALCILVSALPVMGRLNLAGLTPQYLFLFALGMLAAQLAVSGHARCDRVPWALVSALAAVAVVVAVALLGRDGSFRAFPWLDPLVGLAAAALLVSTAREPASRLRTILSTPRVAALGAFAYSIYLVHAPLVQLVWQLAVQPLQLQGMRAFVVLVAVGVPFVLATAYGFFLVFERPFVRPRRPGVRAAERVPADAAAYPAAAS
jgi:peptidoglycan/LPS O-acetylase OafA/YrhL